MHTYLGLLRSFFKSKFIVVSILFEKSVANSFVSNRSLLDRLSLFSPNGISKRKLK